MKLVDKKKTHHKLPCASPIKQGVASFYQNLKMCVSHPDRKTTLGDGACCNTLFLIDHITFSTQERQPKLISSERVICQLDFHQALKCLTHVVLEQ